MAKKDRKTEPRVSPWKEPALVLIVILILIAFALAMQMLPSLGPEVKDLRPSYPLPKSMFAQLPPFPENFSEIDFLLEKGLLKNIGEFGPEFWKQPEFYPGFEDSISKINQSLEEFSRGGFRYVAAYGYGVYPGDYSVAVKRGESITVTTFFHSSWQVENWQGTQLEVAFPASGEVFGTPVTQNPADAERSLNIGLSERVILFDPTLPAFGSNWTHRIAVTIRANPDAKSGIYLVGVNAARPPYEMSQAWLRQYRTRYVDVAGGFGTIGSRPLFQVLVEVGE